MKPKRGELLALASESAEIETRLFRAVSIAVASGGSGLLQDRRWCANVQQANLKHELLQASSGFQGVDAPHLIRERCSGE